MSEQPWSAGGSDGRRPVLLRPFTVTDVAMLQELSTDPYVPLTGTLPLNADAKQARDWIERQHEKNRTGRRFGFCVVVSTPGDEPGMPVGTCGLSLSADCPRTAAGGYAIVPSQRGHGWAAQALLALMEMAATRTRIDLVELFIEDWNRASERTAERAGFTLNGTVHHPRATGGEPVRMRRWTRAVGSR